MDLNLLTALDALLEHGSVQGAAAQLHVTPPAMSRSLSRLRRSTGDELLVRDGRGMVPTARALELQEEVRELVARSQQVLTPPRTLDVATLDRRFTLRGNDSLLVRLAPPLIGRLATEAPLVTVRLLGEDVDPGAELVRGLVDLDIGAQVDTPPSVRSRRVGQDHLAAVLRTDHPLAGAALTLAAFAAAAHITVSRRGRLRGPVDDALDEHGLERQVTAALPSLATALAVVRRTDVLLVAPRRLVDGEPGVTATELPIDLPPLAAALTWHRRLDDDLAHRWLREVVATVVEDVFDPG